MPVNEQTVERLQRLIAKAISDLRRARGLSIAELASAADISEPAMEAIESGFDPPTIICFVRIADALECAPSELLALAERSGSASDAD